MTLSMWSNQSPRHLWSVFFAREFYTDVVKQETGKQMRALMFKPFRAIPTTKTMKQDKNSIFFFEVLEWRNPKQTI